MCKYTNLCEYAEYNNKDQLICKPYKSLCLFCRQGNGLRYKHIIEHLENVYTEEFEDENV
jgi:hypothetical protein